MKVCLVGAPAVTDFDNREFAESDAVRLVAHQAPLGVLTLAAIVRQAGVDVDVVDLDALYYEYLRTADVREPDGFVRLAAGHLRGLTPDVLGFATLCSSYPVTLRIAEAAKSLLPQSVLLLGGPQVSVVDRETLDAFRFVDFVIRGEADRSFLEFLECVAAGSFRTVDVRGLTYRVGGEAVRTAPAELVQDLDSLPLPAFDLYPQAGRGLHLPLELGRGCPYACTFCSTNDFFRRQFRLKSPGAMLSQMRELHETFGVSAFSLVHDMFTVDHRRVTAFCRALLAADEGFTWSCSARTDRVDEELMRLMFEAGCRGIFFGIETGSQRLQKTIAKNLKLEIAAETIRVADRIGIETEVSLIAGFSDEEKPDLEDTLTFYMDAMRLARTDGNIGLLAPLAGTPIEREYHDQLYFDELHSDVSFQGWRQDSADRELILQHKKIFPNFYAVPMKHLSRSYVHEVREFAVHGVEWFRRLMVTLHSDSGNLLAVFDDWRDWRAINGGAADAGWEHVPYYIRPQFRREFLCYLEDRYIPGLCRAKDIVEGILQYERIFRDPYLEIAHSCQLPARPEFGSTSVPQQTADGKLLRFPVPLDALDRTLCEGACLSELRREPVTLVLTESRQKVLRVLQLSAVLSDLLHRCDGSTSLEAIARDMLPLNEEATDVSPVIACRFGLLKLWSLGLVVERNDARLTYMLDATDRAMNLAI